MTDQPAPGEEPHDGVGQPEGGGRTGGGESGGGAYKDPDQVKGNPDSDGHGGQSNIKYHGPGDADDGSSNPNAVAESD